MKQLAARQHSRGVFINTVALSCPLLFLQACGVDFEIRAFCAKSMEEKIHKR